MLREVSSFTKTTQRKNGRARIPKNFVLFFLCNIAFQTGGWGGRTTRRRRRRGGRGGGRRQRRRRRKRSSSKQDDVLTSEDISTSLIRLAARTKSIPTTFSEPSEVPPFLVLYRVPTPLPCSSHPVMSVSASVTQHAFPLHLSKEAL